MVDKNDALLREVDEELRREQLEKLWEKYGIYVVALAAVVVAVVGGMKYWEGRQRALAEAGGAQFEAALALVKDGKKEDAEKAFKSLMETGQPGYAALSALSIAAQQLKDNRPQDALASFEKVASDTSLDPTLSSFARLQAAALRLGQADFAEMQTRLGDLMVADGPWRRSAREFLGIAAIKAGKLDEARNILTPLLADSSLSQESAERIGVLMSTIAAGELAKASPSADKPADGGAAATAPK